MRYRGALSIENNLVEPSSTLRWGANLETSERWSTQEEDELIANLLPGGFAENHTRL